MPRIQQIIWVSLILASGTRAALASRILCERANKMRTTRTEYEIMQTKGNAEVRHETKEYEEAHTDAEECAKTRKYTQEYEGR